MWVHNYLQTIFNDEEAFYRKDDIISDVMNRIVI